MIRRVGGLRKVILEKYCMRICRPSLNSRIPPMDLSLHHYIYNDSSLENASIEKREVDALLDTYTSC
ncbi:hypothetical protein V1477_005368 [Vespula maculifrons]|uniref:Uncharacterized protein n=1 Tax=Vespula maculifrons TaxID=7453 RepID=A0ABD2CPF3_VESMC